MGGQSAISFLAYDAYAKRNGIVGEHFEVFIVLMMAIDDEWLEHVDREAKEAQEKADRKAAAERART